MSLVERRFLGCTDSVLQNFYQIGIILKLAEPLLFGKLLKTIFVKSNLGITILALLTTIPIKQS